MISSCSQIKYGDVFELTDNFAEKLTTTYQHYDMLGQHAEQTKDKEYQVTPMGRLIVVKINRIAKPSEYESLCNALKSHYKGDKRVSDVFINKGGTVVVDCR